MSFEEQMQFLLVSQKSHDDQIAALIEQDTLLKKDLRILTKRTKQAMRAIARLANIAASADKQAITVCPHSARSTKE